MNSFSLCFIGPQELIVILVMITIPTVLIGLVIFALIKYLRKVPDKSKEFSSEAEGQINSFHAESFNPENFRDYYPVKEGSKISLIRYEDIVDFSADNSYVFLTDFKGVDYLVESNLAELESKLPKDFIRVHKSTIINSKRIGEIKKLANGRYDIVMKCEKSRIIPCSKSYNENIKSIIDF